MKKEYTFRNYREYLEDNPKGYWFKRRLYGWGWFPANWKGWITILIFIILIILNGILFGVNTQNQQPTIFELITFFLTTLLLVIALISICYKKGEKPKWTWGRIIKEK